MVDAASGPGRRKDWEFKEEPPPSTRANKPLVGWGHEPAPSVGLPPPNLTAVYRHPLVPDLSVFAEMKDPVIAEVTRSHQSFTSLGDLSAEVMRLKKELGSPGHDEPTRAALRRQIGYRQAEWVAKAKAAGMQPPAGPIDPFRASKKDIENAFLWSAAGGVIPREELARDGGSAYSTSVRDAVVLRTRGFETVLALHHGHPEEQRGLLEKELTRRGVPVPAGATMESLRALYGQSVRNEEANRAKIGVDGRVGRAEKIDQYDRQDAIDALNPGSTLGSMMVTYSTLVTGEVDADRMRNLGDAGNAAEGVLGSNGDPIHK